VKRISPFPLVVVTLLWLSVQGVSAADALAPVTAPAGPSLTVTLLRLIGGLLVVFGLFLGGIWLLKRAPMMVGKRGDTRKLQVVEMRSLAPRQALYVIGYEQQRFLLASTPTGVSLLTALPDASAAEAAPAAPATGNFTDALLQAIQKQGQS
jgi:flagellar biogenesis protein FliO